MPAYQGSGSSSPQGRYRVQWHTQKFLQTLNQRVAKAAERVRADAETYWREEEWTTDRHPEMTGDERDQGYFRVVTVPGKQTRIIMGSKSTHAVYEELGTATRPGHYPLRKTLDVASAKLAPAIRQALRGGGS